MKRIAIFLMSLFALASCAKDDLGNVAPNATGTTTVTFSADGFDEVNTRAVNETSINDVTILQFVSGTLTKKIDLSGVTFGSAVEVDGLVSMPATTMETVTINGTEVTQIDENTQENVIVFLANTTVSNSDLSLTESSTTFKEFQSMTMGTLDLSTYLPMVGYYYDGIIAGATNQMVVSLKRSVAKISFTLNTSNFTDSEGNIVSPVVNSITLCNVPTQITPYACQNRPALPVSPNNGVWPETQVPFPTYDSGTFSDDTASGNQSTTPTASGTFYMPENCRGSYDGITSNAMKIPTNVTGENEESLTYIYVKLQYTAASGIIREANYKIYLGGNSTGDMNLLRNTNYSVTTYLYGADTEDTDIRIDYNDIWNPNNVDFTDVSIEPVANCYMIDPTADMPTDFNISLMQAREGWIAIDSYTGANGANTAAFDALIQSGNWEIITLWRTWGASQGDGYNITGSPLGLSMNEGATDNGECDYYAALTFGTNVKTALNGAGGNAVIALVDTSDSNKVYWSWHLWFTDYKPSSTDGTATKGRVEQYGGTAFATSGQYADKYLMDRNLGASVTGLSADWTPPTMSNSYDVAPYAGMYYQFGRKDPFVGCSSSSNSTDLTIYNASGGVATVSPELATDVASSYSVNDLLATAVNNPLSIYFVGSGIDWTLLSGDNDFWYKSSSKSPFDPCPAGWRLPISDAWSDFTSANSTYSTSSYRGIVYNSTVFYPATGTRNHSTGKFSNVGTTGYFWSASNASGANGYYFYFTSSGVQSESTNSYRRAYGLPVRPIQE